MRAESLYAGHKARTWFNNFLDKDKSVLNKISNPLTTFVLGYGTNALGAAGYAGSFVLGALGNRLYKNASLIVKNPYVREKLNELSYAASIGNKAMVISNIKDIDQAVNKQAPVGFTIKQGGYK
jgi:hypothetical protein